ncbi:MAG: family 1 glycosylhydrolase [Microthrixaceae bacterium]|nr:family 1 glycosylhydrolase [Microthrixaceae bacterium]
MIPPGVSDLGRARSVGENFVAGHRAAVDAIRSAASGVPVGLTLSMQEWTPVGDTAEDVAAAQDKIDRSRAVMDDMFLQATGSDDFIGVPDLLPRPMGQRWDGRRRGRRWSA